MIVSEITFGIDVHWIPTNAIRTQCKKVGEVGMSATIFKWIVVYDDGNTEEKYGASLYDFVDDLVEVPVAIIRSGWER